MDIWDYIMVGFIECSFYVGVFEKFFVYLNKWERMVSFLFKYRLRIKSLYNVIFFYLVCLFIL